MPSVLRRLTPLVGIAVLLAAIFVLRDEVNHLTLAGLAAALGSLKWTTVTLAIGLTMVNYAVLTGYDQLAFIYLGRAFPRWQIAMASFVGYAISNSVGFAMLSGASARYRYYARWGLKGADISRVVVFYSGTFWLGLLVLGGGSLLFHPPSGLAATGWGWAARPFGVLLVGISIAYVAAAFLARSPIRVRQFKLTVPSPRLVAGQFALSVSDWALAATILWLLIPAPRPAFIEVLSAFLAAQFLGLVLNVPGGLVVFEATMLALLAPVASAAALASALVAFRIIYYLLPLAVALAIVVVDEAYIRRRSMRRWGVAVGNLTISLAPKLLAGFTFLAGVVLLFSGATPEIKSRFKLVAGILPDAAIELSHFLGSIVGLGLLLVSQALARRVDAAWTVTVISLVIGIFASLFKGADVEEATILAFLLVLLVASRKEFDRRATLFEHTFSRVWFTAVILVVLASVVLGIAAFREEYHNQFFWRIAQLTDVKRFERATIGVAVVLLFVGIRQLLRPAPLPLPKPTDADLAQASRVINNQRDSAAFLVYLRDKAILWNDAHTAFLMYGVQGRTWVALHDPIGPTREAPGLIRRFLEIVDDSDGVPVFYEVGRDHLHLYADFGLAFAKAGEEALVPLPAFSMDGGARKKLRMQTRKLEKDGATFRVIPAADVPAILPTLRQVSDAWLADKAVAEKGFSLGFWDDDYVKRFPVVVLEKDREIQAFANLWLGPSKMELSVDLMRQRPTAPPNTMEGLFIFLMQWGRDEGYQSFNLGMAPLSGMETTAMAPLWVKIASYLYRYGETFYNFQGLRAYKDKFDPIWESKYLAYPGGLALPRVLADVSALIAGGYRGLLLKRGRK